MDEIEFEDSDDDSDVEANDFTSQIEDGSIGEIMLRLNASHFRYKDLHHAFSPSDRKYLEKQLHRYARSVGKELSQQIAYSLGCLGYLAKLLDPNFSEPLHSIFVI